MATTPDLQEPQIAAARTASWHQTGEALLTLDAARTWLDEYGLLLFAPRGASLGAPAPSLVEATLGAEKQTVSLAEAETARTLAARLVGEGSAVPLNLLGGPGDSPDFLVATQAFPFVFTLRGDKGWKRAPETSGAVKVTPLGLRVYELLVEKGSLTIAEIVPEIGREVTESAVARALNELWQILRVIPVLQQGEGETRWELLTTRFLKAVKAGANAGQPTALSALVSLYLTQVYVATEEEIAAFLSPLTARSRVRDVVHGLVAGRQLAEGVVNGKTVLFVPDALPDFAAFAPENEQNETAEAAPESGEGVTGDTLPAEDGPQPRIRSLGSGERRDSLRGKPSRRTLGSGPRDTRANFAPRRDGGASEPRSGGGFKREGRPAGKSFGGKRSEDSGSDRPFARSREDNRGERSERRPRRGPEDRPFRRRDEGERAPRTGEGRAEGRPQRSFGEGARGYDRGENRGERRPARPFGNRPFRPAGGDEATAGENRGQGRQDNRRAPRTERREDEGGARFDRPFRSRPQGGGERPFRRENKAGDRGPQRERPSRPFGSREGAGAGEFPRRESSFRQRPDGGDRPPRPFRPRGDGEGRPFPRREGGQERPFRPRSSERPSGGRPSGGRPSGEGASRGPRSFQGRPDRAGFGSRGGQDRPGRSDRPQGRPSGRGDFRGPGSRPAGRSFPPRGDRPSRPPRKPRPETEE